MFDDTNRSVDVVIGLFDESSLAPSIEVSDKIRALGLSCELYSGFDKLAKQFKYANERGARYVALIGSEEMLRREVTLKDMLTASQTSGSWDKLAIVDGNLTFTD